MQYIQVTDVINVISFNKEPLPVAFGYALECDHTLESNPPVLWYLHTFSIPTIAARNRDALEDLGLNTWSLPMAVETASLSSRVTGISKRWGASPPW